MIHFSKKAFLQSYLRMMRHKGTPESVGRGVAIGLFIAFFIPFSVQMLIAFPLALWLRAAKFPALLFTWVTNPLTIPFVYPLQCYVGSWLIGLPFTYEYIRKTLGGLFRDPSFSSVLGLGGEIALAFFAGGFVFGLIAAVAGYITSVRLVLAYRQNKEQRKEQRMQLFKTRI